MGYPTERKLFTYFGELVPGLPSTSRVPAEAASTPRTITAPTGAASTPRIFTDEAHAAPDKAAAFKEITGYDLPDWLSSPTLSLDEALERFFIASPSTASPPMLGIAAGPSNEKAADFKAITGADLPDWLSSPTLSLDEAVNRFYEQAASYTLADDTPMQPPTASREVSTANESPMPRLPAKRLASQAMSTLPQPSAAYQRQAFAVYQEIPAADLSIPQRRTKRRKQTAAETEASNDEQAEASTDDQENIDPTPSKDKKRQGKNAAGKKAEGDDDGDSDQDDGFVVDAAAMQRKTDAWRARVESVVEEISEEDVQGFNGDDQGLDKSNLSH
ncbi:hypothetical protein LTR17_012852 [Elasticomyces elasticus]|nr:hypothetical protein LTR17_012852 [Elasticomyces elasticus]